MRIAYKNILDDVASNSITASSEETGYEIENVQDQRLSTKWKTSSATEQSVIFTLDTFPTYPDNVSGQSYFQHFDTATTDSWLAYYSSTYETVFATTSNFIIAAASTTTLPYVGIYRNQAWTTGQTLIFKFPYDADLQYVRYYNGTAYTTMTLVNDNDINYFAEASMIHGSTYTLIQAIFYYASTAIAATKTIPIDYVYLGDGKYDYALEDLSGNGNDGTCYNVVPGQKGLLFNKINSYISIPSIVPGLAYSIACKFKATKNVTDVQMLVSITTDEGLIGLYISGGALYAASRNTAGSEKEIHTSVTANIEYKVVMFVASQILYLYLNGVLIGSVSGVDAIFSSSTGGFIGSNSASTYFFGGEISDIYIFNKSLTEAEITHLYNDESFITENDGLVGKWNINNGLGVNTAAILGHNLDTATLTAKIQASDNNYWTDPPVDETLTISPTTILKFLSDTYYYKYWRFYFPEGLSALEIGRLWLGDYITIDPSSLTDFKVIKKRSDTVIHGKDRQKWASEGVGWRRIEMNFPPTEETMIRKLTNFYSDVRNHSSFIFMNFDSIREYALVEPIYCSIDGSLGFTHDNRMKFSWSLNIEEEL